MTRFAMAAVLAAVLGTNADAQIYQYTNYGTPVYTYPSVVTSGYYTYPGTYNTYYTPASYWSGYTYPSYSSSSYYTPGFTPMYTNSYRGTYISPRTGVIGGRRAWRW